MKTIHLAWLAFIPAWLAAPAGFAQTNATAENHFKINLAPPAAPDALLPESPFGINTAFRPDAPDLNGRLEAMQAAGIKWFVPYDKVRTSHLPVPLGESPIYVVGPKGMKATIRPDPGW